MFVHLRYTVCVGKHWPVLLLNADVVEDTQHQSTVAIILCTHKQHTLTEQHKVITVRLQMQKLLLLSTVSYVQCMTYSEEPLVSGGFQLSPFLASVWGQRTGLESDEASR